MSRKKRAKKRKRERLRNKKLLKKYPWLLPRNDWTGLPPKNYDYSWTELYSLPTGWRIAFGELIAEDLDRVLRKEHYVDKYRILQIKEKYGCYDDQTEVLTKDGWKYFRSLSYEDQIMTLNPDTNEIEYQYPTDIIAEKYNGDMYHLENRGLSLLVTPNHQLYVAKGSYYNGSKNNEKKMYPFELTTPDKYFKKDKRFKKGGAIWNGYNPYGTMFKIKGQVYTNTTGDNHPINPNTSRTYTRDDYEVDMMSWMRFLGFYVAEGCSDWMREANRKYGNNGGTISIAYNPYDEEDLVQKLIRDIGFEPKDGGRRTKRIYSVDIAEWLFVNCGHRAWNKKVPTFIKTLPKEYIEEFLKYLYIGDGHKTATSNILTTTSKQLSDDVQELLIKCGYSFREFIRDRRGHKGGSVCGNEIITKHISYDINWLQLEDIEIDNSKARKSKSFIERWEPYKGVVYCVTVPNHIIYIRRNGKGVWCGNSLRWYDNSVPKSVYDEYRRIISAYESISECICICCGAVDVHMTNTGWLAPLCKHCYETRINCKKPYEDVIDAEDNGRMPDSYTIRCYSNGGYTDTTYDISDITNRVRMRYERIQKRRSRRRLRQEGL